MLKESSVTYTMDDGPLHLSRRRIARVSQRAPLFDVSFYLKLGRTGSLTFG